MNRIALVACGTACAWLQAASALSPSVLDFSTATHVQVSDSPIAIAAGDFNRDGKIDLAVAKNETGTIALLFNKTSALPPALFDSFDLPLGTGGDVWSLAAGDLTGDGVVELLATNAHTRSVAVYVNGSGPNATTPNFQQPISVPTGNGPRALAIANLDHAPANDLVVANESDATIGIYRSNGVGPDVHFVAPLVMAVDAGPVATATGDLNADGLPDIVTANRLAGTLSVLINTYSDGSPALQFGAATSHAIGSAPWDVEIGDVNDDGRPDIVATVDGGIVVLLNDTPAGASIETLRAPKTIAAGGSPGPLALQDLNADGQLDVITADRVVQADETSQLRLSINNTSAGAATVSLVPTFIAQSGPSPMDLAIADIDGNGKPDVVTANGAGGTKGVSVIFNTPDFPVPDGAQSGGGALPASGLLLAAFVVVLRRRRLLS